MGASERWGHALQATGADVAYVDWRSVFDLSERPSVVLVTDVGPSANWHVALQQLCNVPMLFNVPVIVVSDAISVRERYELFLYGVLGIVSTSDLHSDRFIALLSQQEPSPLPFGQVSVDNWVHLTREQLIQQLDQVTGENVNGETELFFGNGRSVASTLAGFVERTVHFVAPKESGISLKRSTNVQSVVTALSQLPSRSRQYPLKRLRVLVATSNPQFADRMTRALRKGGALVAVTDGTHAGNLSVQALDPHVILVSDLDDMSGLRSDLRLRWGTLHFVKYKKDVMGDESYANPIEEDLQRQLIEYLDEEDANVRRLLVEGSLVSDLGLWGAGRWLRWLSALEGCYRLTVSDIRATVRLEVCDGLLVAANMQGHGAQEGALHAEGVDVMDYLLLMDEGRMRFESIGKPMHINVVTMLSEELDKLRLSPREIISVRPPSLPPPIPTVAPPPVMTVMRPTWVVDDPSHDAVFSDDEDSLVLPTRFDKLGPMKHVMLATMAAFGLGALIWYLLTL